MNKFDRITAILIHLQSKRLVTAQELSDRFEVSNEQFIETLNLYVMLVFLFLVKLVLVIQ